jgi:hypothetical protein
LVRRQAPVDLGVKCEITRNEEIEDLRLRNAVCAVLVLAMHVIAVPGVAAGGDGERRGEIGVQLGLRWLDGDIVPEDSDADEPSWGIGGAWAVSDRWAIFGDVNTSTHDSIELCDGSEICHALTPIATIKVVTVGLERRLKRGARGGQWVLGVATGMMDIEWNGIQVHHGILSLNFGRRMPIGPGAARIGIRAETGFSGRTDNQLDDSFPSARITNVVVLVGWGFGFGGRF